MISARRILRLSLSDVVLLGRVSLLVAIIRVIVWGRRWSSVPPLVARLSRSTLSTLWLPRPDAVSSERLAWAVRSASRLLPAATCLTQSLALQCLLMTAGRSCSLAIGVAKGPRGEFQSHAWVEHDGLTLLSSPAEVARYRRLL